jgi:hypothetical protein
MIIFFLSKWEMCVYMCVFFFLKKKKTLGCLKLYLALRVNEPPTPMELSTPHEIIKHE